MKQLLAVSLISLCVPFATAEDFVEWVGPNSGVNWSAGAIQAEGAGVGPSDSPPALAKMMACRAAVVDAQRNLLESIQGVRVQGTTIVENMMVESDVIKTSVDGLLQGAQVVNRDARDDSSCFVQMTAPIGGRFATDVYGEVFAAETIGSHFSPTDALIAIITSSLDFVVPEAQASEAMPWQASIDKLGARISSLEELLTTHPAVVAAQDSGPTGIVIDARGSNFIPSMSPIIRQLRKGVIYPQKKHQTSRRERGQLVSLFTRDLDTARRHPVVGEKPIVLKALRTFGNTRTSIVLGSESSERLVGLVDEGLLDDAGVIIVL